MRCAACGNDNLPQARFCSRCGTPLAEVVASTPTPPLAQPSPSMARDQGEVRISAVTPVIAMLLAGLILGMMATLLYYRYYGSPFTMVFSLVWAVGGVLAAFWLSSRLRLAGRVPSTLGMLAVLFGALIAGVAASLAVTYVGHGLIGVGLGLAMPPSFWRGLSHRSLGSKVALVVAMAAALSLGYWSLNSFGFQVVYLMASTVALLGGVPAALASPTVRRQ